MKLYDHQKRIIDADPKRCGIFTGTGTGKTKISLLLARKFVIVICPKTQKEDRNWEREYEKLLLEGEAGSISRLLVVSKEEFRRDWMNLPACDTLIIDEAHTALGATPNVAWKKGKPEPKTSQIFDCLQKYIIIHQPERIYPCTATIAKSPMTVWACARILGRDWNFYEFRDAYYFKLPMPGREVYTAKSDSATKDRLARAVNGLGYTGKLADFFDVPDQTFRNEFVDITVKQRAAIATLPFDFPEPIVLLGKTLQVENGILAGDEFNEEQEFENNKIDKLLDYAAEFPRMIIFSRYLGQIYQIRKAMNVIGKATFVMTGDTKNRGELIKQVNACEDYVFIVSAQISAGWELPGCEVMVFASRTYSIVDLEQSWGRIHRANALKKNLYINLIVKDGIDQAVHDCLENKKDFSERLFLGI